MIRFILFTLYLYLSGIQTVQAITIYNDYGGYVYKYWKKATTTQEVRFDGYCASACTLYLIVENKCATKRARFGFHLAYSQKKNSQYMELSHPVSQMMFEQYPDWVQKWIKANGGLKRQVIVMPNSYIMKHMKAC